MSSPFEPPIFTPGRPQPALEPRQLTAIALLTAGKSVASVAAILQVNRVTLYRWKQDPTFAAESISRRSTWRLVQRRRRTRIASAKAMASKTRRKGPKALI